METWQRRLAGSVLRVGPHGLDLPTLALEEPPSHSCGSRGETSHEARGAMNAEDLALGEAMPQTCGWRMEGGRGSSRS